MAHFAKLDVNNKVLETIVVNNADAPDEVSGVSFLTRLTGYSSWKQTSYNATIRRRFAAIGDTYDPSLDMFITPQPYPSWTLNSSGDWEAPVSCPDLTKYIWDETTLSWVTPSQDDLWKLTVIAR